MNKKIFVVVRFVLWVLYKGKIKTFMYNVLKFENNTFGDVLFILDDDPPFFWSSSETWLDDLGRCLYFGDNGQVLFNSVTCSHVALTSLRSLHSRSKRVIPTSNSTYITSPSVVTTESSNVQTRLDVSRPSHSTKS